MNGKDIVPKESQMKFIASAIVLALLIAGCADKTVKPMPPEQSASLEGKRFDVVYYDAPLQPFVVTPGSAMLMGLGGAIGGALYGLIEGAIHTETTPSTPSLFVSNMLAERLSSDRAMIRGTHPELIVSDRIDAVPEGYKDVDYLINVEDRIWQVVYFPTHWASYKVRYEAQLKVYDVRQNRLIAQSYCSFDPEYKEDAPNYDALFDNNASGLKQYSQDLFQRCADQFYSDLFAAASTGS